MSGINLQEVREVYDDAYHRASPAERQIMAVAYMADIVVGTFSPDYYAAQVSPALAEVTGRRPQSEDLLSLVSGRAIEAAAV